MSLLKINIWLILSQYLHFLDNLVQYNFQRLREEGTDFWPKNRFFFIVLNYFLVLSLPKNLFPMSKFSYNYLMRFISTFIVRNTI